MQLTYIEFELIKSIGIIAGYILPIITVILAVYRWYLKQEKQDADIKALKEEQCLLTYGILACLDGLEQLGCNHTVPETRNKIEKHINQKAHK